MKKTDFIDAINAFADAKATGNPYLVNLAGQHLGSLLHELPDEIPSKPCETTPPANESQP